MSQKEARETELTPSHKIGNMKVKTVVGVIYKVVLVGVASVGIRYAIIGI